MSERTEPFTTEEVERIRVLHAGLDELAACFLDRTRGLLSTTTVMELLQWAREQIGPAPAGSLPGARLRQMARQVVDLWNGYPETTALSEVSDAIEAMGAELASPSSSTVLEWMLIRGPSGVTAYEEAFLGDFAVGDGVRFTLDFRASCYRRGTWRLLVEVAPGPHHEDWGCFDSADQPERNYHSEMCARSEAQAIAEVLLRDRKRRTEGH